MRLELRACSVPEVAFGEATRLREGRLEVSRERLAERLVELARAALATLDRVEVCQLPSRARAEGG